MALSQVVSAIDGDASGTASDSIVRGVSTDSRALRPGQLFFAIRGPRFDGHHFVQEAADRGACACVVRPGFDAPVPLVRVDDVVAALGRLAACHRRLTDAVVIAVTGSNGKTTTKEMLAHVLSARIPGRGSMKSYNNNIGVPLTLLSCEPEDRFVVVEVGSNAPGEIAQLSAIAGPDVGLLTSVGFAHLAGFGDVDGVRREKMSLFDHVREGGAAVVNAAVLAECGVPQRAAGLRWITFGERCDADVRVTQIAGDLDFTVARINEGLALRLAVAGAHNAINAAGAFAVCRHLGLDEADIISALESFRMPGMRLGVRQAGSITVIDDCYNANPTSMAAAIGVLNRAAGRRVLVAGEMAELGRQSEALHRSIGREAVRAGVDLVVAVGGLARFIADEAAAGSCSLRTVFYSDVGEASRLLPEQLNAGDAVLIKGSRSAGLESLADRICEVFR